MGLRHLLAITFYLLVSITNAQKVVSAKGKAQMRVEKNISQAETELNVLELAKMNAIESEFGTFVQQQSKINIDEQKENISIIGETRVKGDWLETEGKPKYNYDTRLLKNGEPEIWITCEVKGKIRSLKNSSLPFEAYILKSASLSAKSTDFDNNENIYIGFKSAIKGYLTIYSVYNNQASRLFPYQNMGEKYISSVPVEQDKTYILFSREKNKNNFADVSDTQVDELKFTTTETLEKDYIYIIYSQVAFVKPSLENLESSSASFTLPASLTEEKFQLWLRDNTFRNADFDYKVIPITIKGK